MQEDISPITIFVSSTMVELSQERSAIKQAVESIPIARAWLFEQSPASSEPIHETYFKAIERADIFVLVLGEKFSEPVLSEYEVARALNKPTLVFVKEVTTRDLRLEEFIQQIGSQVIYARFKSANDLIKLAQVALFNLIIDSYRRFRLTPADVKEPRYKQEVEVRTKRSRRDKRFCFVIMPIGKAGTREHKEFKAVFESLIKPSVEMDDRRKSTGLRCERADEEVKTGNIPADIIEKLASAEIVIADLTTWNPNVFYELGVRHSLRQKTIMIAQQNVDIPFDVKSYRVIFYDPHIGLADESIRELRLAIKALSSTDDIKDSPVLDWIQRE